MCGNVSKVLKDLFSNLKEGEEDITKKSTDINKNLVFVVIGSKRNVRTL